jgi:hypothetical protein
VTVITKCGTRHTPLSCPVLVQPFVQGYIFLFFRQEILQQDLSRLLLLSVSHKLPIGNPKYPPKPLWKS